MLSKFFYAAPSNGRHKTPSSHRFYQMFPRSLAHCKELKVLNVENDQFNGTFPYKLNIVYKLQFLILKSNKFSGLIACLKENSIWLLLQILDPTMDQCDDELQGEYILNRTLIMGGMKDF